MEPSSLLFMFYVILFAGIILIAIWAKNKNKQLKQQQELFQIYQLLVHIDDDIVNARVTFSSPLSQKIKKIISVPFDKIEESDNVLFTQNLQDCLQFLIDEKVPNYKFNNEIQMNYDMINTRSDLK